MEGRMKTAHDITQRLRTDDVLNDENSNIDFASLLLSGPVLEGLQSAGFQRPSPIQLKAIPLGRCGLDLVIQAKSGTGKTCVFSVIALEGVDLSSSATQVLILAPTREIAVQIQQVILDIGRMMPNLRCHVFIGGTLIGPDKQNLKKCHIAVGTPGRVKKLIETEVLLPDSIRLFILDEADKLLDDKFQSQINWIYNELPYNKQMLAASATYPEFLAHHLTSYMRDATFVRLNPKEIALHGIRQYYKLVEGHDLPHKAFALKVNDLINLLSNVTFQQCLVFSNLHTRAENLCDILCQRGWQSVFISGGLEQKQRLHAMSTFKKFECRVLISTDLTARGIDAEKVNLVINLDVPIDVKTYMHRIGRAGRFGTYGASITLASFGREELLLHSIQKECHVPIRPLPDPVPSDLLNPSAEVNRETLKSDDFMSTSKEACHSDKHTMDTQQYTSKSKQSRLSTFDLARQSGDSRTVLSLNGKSSHQDVFGSADLRYSMATVKKPVMVDKGCQVDDPNSVLNFITSEIPSLTETLDSRGRYPMWSFTDALNDFKHFQKTGDFEWEGTKVLEKTCKKSVIKDSESSSHGNHIKSEEKHIQRTLSPLSCEDRENKEYNETDSKNRIIEENIQRTLSPPGCEDRENKECKETDFKSRIIEEKNENDIPNNKILECISDGGIEDEWRSGGMRKHVIEEQGHVILMREMTTSFEGQLSCEDEEDVDLHATGNLRCRDEHNKTDYVNAVEEDLRDRYADTSCEPRMMGINEIGNSRSDSKNDKESLTKDKRNSCNAIFKNKDKEIIVRHKRDMNIVDHEGGKVRLSPDATSSEASWTEESEEESCDGDETGSSDVQSSSSEDDSSENTSSTDGSEGSDTSQTDGEEEEDPTSNIFIVKDGVVLQVNSEKHGSSRKTGSKEVGDPSRNRRRIYHSKEVTEIEEANVVDGRSDVDDRWQEEVRNKRKQRQKHTRMNVDEMYNHWYYYGYSGYPSYYYNGSVASSQHETSPMSYHVGPSYHDTSGGWSRVDSWPYLWPVPHWPTYPADVASLYHQPPVAGNHGPIWYPSGGASKA